MSKDALPESDFVNKSVRPAIVLADWHTLNQIHAQFSLRGPLSGAVQQSPLTDKVLKADFALFHKPNMCLQFKTSAAAGYSGRS